MAIALVGGSKLVVLDEPTAGMDLSARRRLWNMLKRYKQGRIIILTTHYMDEADILGDRIGIMNEGELVCLGSPLFLKSRFGSGYTLTAVKRGALSESRDLEEYIHNKLGPEVKLTSEVSSEANFHIPASLARLFKAFFEQFDRDQELLGIRSYGISVPTLEDVFLRVTNENTPKIIEVPPTNERTPEECNSYSIAEEVHNPTRTRSQTFMEHMMALFIKRFHISRRNWRGLMVEIFIPALLVLIGFGFSQIQLYFSSPPRPLTPVQLPWP